MNKDEIKPIIESVLFFWGDPMSLDTLSELLEHPKAEIRIILDDLIKEYNTDARGLSLRRIDKSYQFVTVPSADEYIRKLLIDRDERSLSSAAMETLSIIAYKQPVTRIEIDSIRGVKSTGSLSTLLARGLIEEAGRLDRIGKPILYRTTPEFLRIFNLADLSELPEPEENPKGEVDSRDEHTSE